MYSVTGNETSVFINRKDKGGTWLKVVEFAGYRHVGNLWLPALVRTRVGTFPVSRIINGK
jgi:hypothetical protein